jgi:GNAT superfamily N-acetyltransferase
MARLAGHADVDEIVRVTNAAYRVEDFFIDGDRTSHAEVRALMATPAHGFLVVPACDGGDGTRLAASVHVEQRGDRLYFAMLAVDPVRQGTGLGRVLLAGIERHARTAGCRALDIDVVDLRTELPAFYRRMGFVQTGVIAFNKRHTLKRPAKLLLMSKELP